MNNKYSEMARFGHSPQDVYLEMKKDGLKFMGSIVLLVKIFNLPLIEAKSIIIKIDTGDDLNTYQEKIADVLKKFIDEEGLS